MSNYVSLTATKHKKNAFVEKIDQIFATLKMQRAAFETKKRKTNFRNFVHDQIFRMLFYLLIRNCGFATAFEVTYYSGHVAYN